MGPDDDRQSLLIEADADVVWKLLAGIDAWSNLFPHVTALEVRRQRGKRLLVRMRVRPAPWFSRWLWSGFEIDPDRKRLTRWHPAGLLRGVVEQWQVADAENGKTSIAWTIHAPGVRHKLAVRLLLSPLALQTAGMIALLAEADRIARSR